MTNDKWTLGFVICHCSLVTCHFRATCLFAETVESSHHCLIAGEAELKQKRTSGGFHEAIPCQRCRAGSRLLIARRRPEHRDRHDHRLRLRQVARRRSGRGDYDHATRYRVSAPRNQQRPGGLRRAVAPGRRLRAQGRAGRVQDLPAARDPHRSRGAPDRRYPAGGRPDQRHHHGDRGGCAHPVRDRGGEHAGFGHPGDRACAQRTQLHPAPHARPRRRLAPDGPPNGARAGGKPAHVGAWRALHDEQVYL